jgi:hypothetical protein
VTEFTADLDTLLELAAIQAKDPRKRKEARDKQRQLEEDGLRIRAAAEAGLDGDLSDAERQQKRRRKASKTSAGAMVERMEESRQEYEKKDKELAELEEVRHREVVGAVIGLVEELKEQRQEAKEVERRREVERREERGEFLAALREIAGVRKE